MPTQLELLTELFTHLKVADPEQEAAAFLSPADGTEPVLNISGILGGAQEYAAPILTPKLKRELSSEFKGQYMGEALNKIVAASKGKIRRANYEDGNIERALADLTAQLETNPDKDDITSKYNEAVQKLADLEAAQEENIAAVRREYEEKESSRLIYDTTLSRLGALENPGEGKIPKKLTVAQDHAARAILREIGEEYALKYDAESKKIGVYNKSNPGEIVVRDGKVVDYDSLLNDSLTRNNWIAQSNGGQAGKGREIININAARPGANNNNNNNQVNRSSFRERLEAQVGDTGS